MRTNIANPNPHGKVELSSRKTHIISSKYLRCKSWLSLVCYFVDDLVDVCGQPVKQVLGVDIRTNNSDKMLAIQHSH